MYDIILLQMMRADAYEAQEKYKSMAMVHECFSLIPHVSSRARYESKVKADNYNAQAIMQQEYAERLHMMITEYDMLQALYASL